jgi:hypothetical protein
MSLLSYIDSESIRAEVEKKFDQLKIPRDFGSTTERLIPAVYRVLSMRPGTKERYHNDNWCIDCEYFASRWEGETDREYSLRLRSVIGSAIPDTMTYSVPYLYYDEDAPKIGQVKKALVSRCDAKVVTLVQPQRYISEVIECDVVVSEDESADEEVDDGSQEEPTTSGDSNTSETSDDETSGSLDESDSSPGVDYWSGVQALLNKLESNFNMSVDVEVMNDKREPDDIGPVVLTLVLRFPRPILEMTCRSDEDGLLVEGIGGIIHVKEKSLATPVVYRSVCDQCVGATRCDKCAQGPIECTLMSDFVELDLLDPDRIDQANIPDNAYVCLFTDENGERWAICTSFDVYCALKAMKYDELSDFSLFGNFIVHRDTGDGAIIYKDSDEAAWDEYITEMRIQRDYYGDDGWYDRYDYASEEYSSFDYLDSGDDDYGDPPELVDIADWNGGEEWDWRDEDDDDGSGD